MASVAAVGDKTFPSFWAISSQLDSKEVGVAKKFISMLSALFMDLYRLVNYGRKYSVQMHDDQSFSISGPGCLVRVNRFYYPVREKTVTVDKSSFAYFKSYEATRDLPEELLRRFAEKTSDLNPSQEKFNEFLGHIITSLFSEHDIASQISADRSERSQIRQSLRQALLAWKADQ